MIAPATHLLGLRVPGSFIDTDPSNTGQVGERFQRGSGTSQAVAVVSGLAALLLQKYPYAIPDAIKALLTDTATPVLRGSGMPDGPGQLLSSGHGLVNVAAALDVGPAGRTQKWPASTGTGTLDGARGSQFVTENGRPLTGQQDIFGHPFDSARMADLQRSAAAWSGGVWNGSTWSGDGWAEGRWATTEWTGVTWTGSRWRAAIWSTMVWTGSRWRGSGWTGSRWRGSWWSTAGWE